MEAKDLRIGNWVESDGNYITVFHIDRDDDRGRINYVGEDQYNPIQLSPEILEKCGFEFKEYEGITTLSDDFDDPKEDGTTKNWTLKIPSSSNIEGIRQFELVQFGNKNILFAHNWLRVPIHHLHQLQNLYFALTGTEINYKP